jgi:hypothetical protein
MLRKLRRNLISSFIMLLSLHSLAAAEPYAFTSNDFIEYGIYFSPGGNQKSYKLLTLRFGDIEGYYAEYFPQFKPDTRKQALKLVTKRGTVRVNRDDNDGVTVVRDTFNEKKRIGTKRLDVTFEQGVCTDSAGVTSACSVSLTLTADGPDRGVVRPPRTLTITTSTGLSFRYRSARHDGGRPINLARLRRMATISNYAWEWRPGRE